MSDIAGRTWTGSREDGTWTAVMREYLPGEWSLEVTWEWDDAGVTVTSEQSVVFADAEDARIAAWKLDRGDDMSQWEDGNGNWVGPLDAALVDAFYVPFDTPAGVRVGVEVPAGWSIEEAVKGYDRRNGTSFADVLGDYGRSERYDRRLGADIVLYLWDSPEDAHRKEAHYDALLAPPEEVLGEDRPREVTGTGRVTSTGNSLIIKVTKECGVLGIDRGDPVEYTIRRI